MRWFKILYIIILSMFLFISLDAKAQKCKFDAVDCKGECGRFIDEDGDEYCDLTIFSKEILASQKKKDTTQKSAIPIITKIDTENKNPETNTAEKKITDQPAVKKSSLQKNELPSAKPTKSSDTIKLNTENRDTKTVAETSQVSQQTVKSLNINADNTKHPTKKRKAAYDFFFILAAVSLLYLLTYFLSSKGVLKKSSHKKIWNGLLLMTFLVGGIFGLLLVIAINYDVFKPTFRALMYWHVEVGIAMSFISIFHIFWHIKYFRNLLKPKQ